LYTLSPNRTSTGAAVSRSNMDVVSAYEKSDRRDR
jgi:hypothetical protein